MEKCKYCLIVFVVALIWLILALNVPFAYMCHADTDSNDFQITKQMIIDAIPTESEVVFTPKIEKEVRIMEKRHFNNELVGGDDSYRIARLERELMGRVWRYTPLEDRMRRLKLASSRTMLAGTSLPPSLNRHFTPKRIHNDSIELREQDRVGIIDGLLRLYAPDLYQKYASYKDRQFERFSE